MNEASTLGPGLPWSHRPVLIGMIHLRPLPDAPRWDGSLEAVLARALEDATALEEAGFDGLMVENFLDAPFHADRVPPVTVAAMTRVVDSVVQNTRLPVGVNVLRNDAVSALSIAAVTGAKFIRVNVHTGAMWSDQGLLTGQAHETLRLRRSLEAPVAVLADVHVKHATPPAGARLSDAASDAWQRGLADGLVVSGSGTGHAVRPDDIAEVSAGAPEAPLFLGSGVTTDTAASLPLGTHGAIVGSAVMRDGRAGAGVDPTRARSFVRAVHDSS